MRLVFFIILFNVAVVASAAEVFTCEKLSLIEILKHDIRRLNFARYYTLENEEAWRELAHEAAFTHKASAGLAVASSLLLTGSLAAPEVLALSEVGAFQQSVLLASKTGLGSIISILARVGIPVEVTGMALSDVLTQKTISLGAIDLLKATNEDFLLAHKKVDNEMAAVDFGYSRIANGFTFGRLAAKATERMADLVATHRALFEKELQVKEIYLSTLLRQCEK